MDPKGDRAYTRRLYAQWVAAAIADLTAWLVGEGHEDQRLAIAVEHVLDCSRRMVVVDAATTMRSFGWPCGPRADAPHYYDWGGPRGGGPYCDDWGGNARWARASPHTDEGVHQLVDALVHAPVHYARAQGHTTDVPERPALASYVRHRLALYADCGSAVLTHPDASAMCWEVAHAFACRVHTCGEIFTPSGLPVHDFRPSAHTRGLARAVIAGDAQAIPILCDAIEDDGGDPRHFRNFGVRLLSDETTDVLRRTHGSVPMYGARCLLYGARGLLAIGHPAGCRRLVDIAYGN